MQIVYFNLRKVSRKVSHGQLSASPLFMFVCLFFNVDVREHLFISFRFFLFFFFVVFFLVVEVIPDSNITTISCSGCQVNLTHILVSPAPSSSPPQLIPNIFAMSNCCTCVPPRRHFPTVKAM